MTEDQLTTKEVAEILDLSENTIRIYRKRGRFPNPDGVLGKTPWWRRATIDKWTAERPGMGRPPKGA